MKIPRISAFFLAKAGAFVLDKGAPKEFHHFPPCGEVAPMADWKKLAKRVVLADGRIDAHEAHLIRVVIEADKKLSDETVDFLVDLRDHATETDQAFTDFFFEAMEKHILSRKRIEASEVKKLRKIIMSDGKVDPDEKRFLQTLASKAKKRRPPSRSSWKNV
jgi:uncharacterized tellurite resistance protein B-like protein